MDIITLRILEGSWVIKRSPKHNDMCSIRDAQTEKNIHRRGGGRDWRNVATSQELPRIAGSLQKLEEARKDPS